MECAAWRAAIERGVPAHPTRRSDLQCRAIYTPFGASTPAAHRAVGSSFAVDADSRNRAGARAHLARRFAYLSADADGAKSRPVGAAALGNELLSPVDFSTTNHNIFAMRQSYWVAAYSRREGNTEQKYQWVRLFCRFISSSCQRCESPG